MNKQNKRDKFYKRAKYKLLEVNGGKLSQLLRNENKSKYKEWREDYYALVWQGRRLKQLNVREFRVFAMAVYGWMPVMYSQINIDKLRKNVTTLLLSEKIQKQNFVKAKQCFKSRIHTNGSLSALSKLLHFCAPAKFSIWDSRVGRSLGVYGSELSKPEVYIDYLASIDMLKSDPDLSEYYKMYRQKIDPRATKLRSIEHGLFLLGKK